MSEFLEVIWAKTHNLKNITVKIPKNKLTVITGLSGSGKSSLAFKTIYAIWQQKYLESLSSYARMFIGNNNDSAEVDEIKWLSPTISIDQKTTSKNPRSTVGTITEIYDYYKLLYLNLWERRCVNCNNIIKKDSVSSVITDLSSYDLWTKFLIKAPIFKNKSWLSLADIKSKVLELWFIRFSIWTDIYTINDDISLDIDKSYTVDIIVDRLVVKDFSDKESADTKRLKDSLELAFKTGEGFIDILINPGEDIIRNYSSVFVCSECWHVPEELNISSFTFNSHSWACMDCHGLWEKAVFLEEKIVNPNLTLAEWAIIAPWFWGDYFLSMIQVVANKNKVRLDVKYSDLTKKEKDLVLYWTWETIYKVDFTNEHGIKNTYNSRYEWVINALTRRYLDGWWETTSYDQYLTSIECPTCLGHRLKQESLSIYFRGINIWEMSNMSVFHALEFFRWLELNKYEETVSKKVLKNIIERLEFLSWVWLDYISVSRKSNTLSGWESQRIRLATQIGTRLEWIIYVLDEPSIWLHPRDNDMLIENLKKLRDIGNTLIVVEHDEDIMQNADYIIDIWPWAWHHGWSICAEWTIKEIIENKNSITGPFLSWKETIVVKRPKRTIKNYIDIVWASEHNLKNIDVSIPLNNLVVVTGVSWSGKSSLVNDILANYLANKLNRASRQVWSVTSIKWLKNIDKALIIDQSAIWKTPRSNPATYTWVFTYIREVFAMTQEAEIRWYGPGRFSFNTKAWRCADCEWDWVKKIDMHFLPSVYVTCESCDGKRFNKETLMVTYKWKTISDVLNLSVEEALDFFKNQPRIEKILNVLNQVWLGYIKLWQSSTTLSWWEAQRIKLATELSKRSTSKTFYILDEPTTWLHFQDTQKLLSILHSLVDKGNSVLVIEHNMDVILNADYIIDIWPEWWDKWGNLMAYWTIDEIRQCQESFTGQAINKYLKK